MAPAPQVEIVEADVARPDHQASVAHLIDCYARDSIGGGKALAADVRERLIPALRQHPTTLILLAYANQEPVGVAVCFLGFSTFAARPLVNVHDLAVVRQHRGQGIGGKLLDAVTSKARELDCCKVTLEVRADNEVAKRLYRRRGFGNDVAGAAAGDVLFWQKRL